MGFSLRMFFAGLFKVLEMEGSDADKLAVLTKMIKYGHKYAKDCGDV